MNMFYYGYFGARNAIDRPHAGNREKADKIEYIEKSLFLDLNFTYRLTIVSETEQEGPPVNHDHGKPRRMHDQPAG